jgi:isoleucyl-tRNA synthetase
MKGYDVLRKGRFGIRTAFRWMIEVEKQLGLDGKEQIEAYGIEAVHQGMQEIGLEIKTEWEHMSDRVGFWADMTIPYITYEDNYIESIWWALKTIMKRACCIRATKPCLLPALRHRAVEPRGSRRL